MPLLTEAVQEANVTIEGILSRLERSPDSEAGLGDLMALAPKILKGEVRGRVVVDVAR